MRILTSMLALVPICVTALCGQPPSPHDGWKLVPGGENLLVNGYWDAATQGDAPVLIQVSNGVLTATALKNYLGNPNVLAPRLETKGDFGMVATMQTAAGMDGLITLTGSLQTGAKYYQGWTAVEFGVDNSGSYVFGSWDGTNSNPTFQVLKGGGGAPAAGTMTVELLRKQGQFYLYFNGAQYGPIADPGLFTLGFAIPGFTVFPNQQLKLTQLAFEVPSDDVSARLVTPTGHVTAVHNGASLGSLAAATGRTFGVAIGGEEFVLHRNSTYDPSMTGGSPDPTFAPKVVGEFNSIVAAKMYYFMTETGQGDFTFGDGDAILADAEDNGLPAHCHHLIGPNGYLPTWVVNGNFTAAQLTQIMTTHIQTVVGHFKGRCASWDVVNEALNDDGTVSTTKNIWAQTIGPSYIDLAFQTTHQVDPSAKLYYNEYGVENQTAKIAGLYSLLAGMQQRGTPIDGVGLQCHWNASGSDPYAVPNHDSMVANMARLAKMGLSVRVSELDAKIQLPASAATLANQASTYSTTVQACLDSPNCNSIVVWGADDSLSWIPGFFPGYGAATLFDANFQPKPAYTSVMNTLRAAPLSAQAASLTAAAGGGSLQVNAPAGVAWTAQSNDSWITITSGASGTGSGAVGFSLQANTGAARTGTITIEGQTFTITQESASIAGLTLAGSMAQIASAGGWDTSLTLVNLGAAPGEARLNLFANDGSAPLLPFTFLQPPALGTTLGSSFDQNINANASLVLDTTGPASQTSFAGSAQLLKSGTIDGFAIFQVLSTAQQAVVPLETRNAPSYLLAFDYTNGLLTGLALANVSATAGNVKVVVRDDTGAVIPTKVTSIPLDGNGHASFMLNDATKGFPEIAGKRGTVEFDTPAGGRISVLGIRVNGKAITTLPVLAQIGTTGGALAHVATGDGWETGFTLVNTGTSAAQFTLSFYDEKSGVALPLALAFPQTATTQTTASLTQTLAPGATLLIRTQGGSSAVTCSAHLTTTGQVSGFAIFQYLPSAQEAVVPLETRTPAAYVLAYDNTTGLATGVALANMSAQSASVPVVVRDETGATLTQSQIQLAGNGHTSFMLTDAAQGFPATAGMRGTIEFKPPVGGRISALGIRAVTATNVITTIPVLAKQ